MEGACGTPRKKPVAAPGSPGPPGSPSPTVEIFSGEESRQDDDVSAPDSPYGVSDRQLSAFGGEGAGSPEVETRVSEAARASVSSACSDGSSPEKTGRWEENLSACQLCGARLGKRHLNPRHHCRLCGRCVCGACSPNVVQLQGQSSPQRACKECMANFSKSLTATDRVAALARHISNLSGAAVPEGFGGVDEAANFCERAMLPLAEDRERLQRRVSELEGALRSARAACGRLAGRLLGSEPQAELQSADLGKVVAACEAALEARVEISDARTPLFEPEPPPRPRRRCCRARLLACLFSVLVAVLGALLAFRLAVPALAQRALGGATVELLGASMHTPLATSLRMNASLVLDNCGPVAAHVGSFRAEISSGGRAFGWCMFPSIVTAAGGPTRVAMDTELHVTDDRAFAAAAAPLLQGRNVEWQLAGSPSVRAVGMTMRLQLSQKLLLPGAALTELRAASVDVVSSTAESLNVSTVASFFSSSVLELRDMGDLVFTVHPVREGGSVDASVCLGLATIPRFAVARGLNNFGNVSIKLEKTARSEFALSDFMSNWLSGVDQLAALKGPESSPSPFLNGLTTQVVRMAGSTSGGLIRSAYVSSIFTLRGHVPETGGSCPLTDGVDCLKGSVVVAGNPMHSEIRLSNLSVDVDVPEPLAYDTVLHMLHIFPIRLHCNKGRQIARMTTAPGMFSYLNRSRASEDMITLPPASYGSFLLEAQPQSGPGGYCLNRRADPEDCCFTTVIPAAACFYRQRAMNFVPASAVGNATLEIGGFSIGIRVNQRVYPITYAEDVPKFNEGPLSMSCDDIVFH